MKSIHLFLLLSAILLNACSGGKTEPENTVADTIPMLVRQIQKCSKLYTAEVKIHKIITHSDTKQLSGTIMGQSFNIDLPLGARKLAIPMDATVKAFIDFEDFSAQNIRKYGDKLEVTLPDPKATLTSTRIDHTRIKQFVALTRSNFSDEELSRFEQQGRQSIIKEIPRIGLTDLARHSAAKTLIPIFTQMGFKEENITITFQKDFNLNDPSSLFNSTTTIHEKAKQ